MTNTRRAVVTGIGVISPSGNSAIELYDSLKNGRSGVRGMTEWKDYFGKVIANAPVTLDPARIKQINRKVRRLNKLHPSHWN